MTIYDMTKKYGNGKGDDTMWKAVALLSNFVEDHCEEDCVEKIKKDLFSIMEGGHYNEEFANEQIEAMFYRDDDGKKHYGPFWTTEEMHKGYQAIKDAVPAEYNEWDVWVTMNMIYSDYKSLFEEWFEEDEITSKVLDMTASFLDDEDAPHAGKKIWAYFS